MEVFGQDISPGMKCIKYLMVAFSSIFVLTGILIIVAGTTIHAIYYNFDQFLETSIFSPATLLIVVGCIIFFVALFGCVGAARESTCMVMMFSLLLGLIFVLELSAAIAAFALQGQVTCLIHDNMINAINEGYMNDPEINSTINTIQSQLSCCGVDGPEDWRNVSSQLAEKYDFPMDGDKDIVLPDSCCASWDGNGTQCVEPLTEGCLHKLSFIVRQSSTLLAAAALTVCMIQIIGIYFAYSLAKALREAKSERTRRLYEIQHQLLSSYALTHPSAKSATVITTSDA